MSVLLKKKKKTLGNGYVVLATHGHKLDLPLTTVIVSYLSGQNDPSVVWYIDSDYACDMLKDLFVENHLINS